MDDQHVYERKLSAWQREQDRQKVEFTITEKDPDADLRMLSPEVIYLISYILASWLHGLAVERQSLAGILLPSCTRPVADG